jgi:GNAT superfamily N-acetyltransferase
MKLEPDPPAEISVRDAQLADLAALVAIKDSGSEVEHHDRLRDAQAGYLRYLVLLLNQTVIGAVCLVFHRPPGWSDAADTQHLPQLVDLKVLPAYRGKSYGTAFISAIEHLAAEAGFSELYLSVEPRENSRAYALYLRLGYQPLQAQPQHKVWEFLDTAGKLHRGEDWVVDMVKILRQ